MARKTWVLETGTKGTGANVVPLEKAVEQSEERERPRRRTPAAESAPRRRPAPAPVETSRTALPPGHVRKKATGEIGMVQAVDPSAGTARVRWLKAGATSTVPLSAITRR